MEDSAAVQLFLPVTIAMIMLSLGLSLQRSDFRAVRLAPMAVGVGLLGQIVVLPLIGLSCALGFGLEPAAAVGLVLLSGCPGGAHSNLFASLARGDTALSICLTALSSLATLLTLPLWVLLATWAVGSVDGAISMPLAETAMTLLLAVILPTLVGMVFRSWMPRAAGVAEPIIKSVAVLLLLLIVVGSVSRSGALVLEHARAVGGAVVTLNLASMTAGLVMARLARLSRPATITIILEVGVQNSAVAVGLAMTLLSLEHAVPAIVYSLFVYLSALLVIAAGRAHRPVSGPGDGGGVQ